MFKPRWVLLVLFIAIVVGAALVFRGMIRHGFSARDEPSAAEAFLAGRMRHWAVPESARRMKNPFVNSAEAVAAGRMHFADHCALCHGNDGRGKTEIGENLYPKAPDMRGSATQALSDGEIFYIIKNGVRLTGMPAWGQDTPEDDDASWQLVSFIRHVPWITPKELEEMKSMNPVNPMEVKEENQIENFLEGDEDSTPPSQKTPAPKHGH